MDRPLLRIFAAMLWAVWFTAVVPLHTRGYITLDGGGGGSGRPSCCCARGTAPANSKDAPGEPSKACAICAVRSVAGITPAPDLMILAPLETQEVVDETLPPVAGQMAMQSLHCRGPPGV